MAKRRQFYQLSPVCYRVSLWKEGLRKSLADRRSGFRAAELRQGIEEYFNARREENRFPTEAGMLLSLGLSEGEYKKLSEDRMFKKEFERARLARMDWLENQMVTESGRSSGCMNALKQEKNGGYADKAALREQKLVVCLSGVGRGAAE